MNIDVTSPAFLLTTAITIPGVAGQILASRNRLAGWSLSLAVQPLWYAFYIVTGGLPGLVLSTGYLIAAVLNIRAELHARSLTLADYPRLVLTAAADRLRRRGRPPTTTLPGETS